ncbi:hypothetical protein AALP_AA8G274700 [Arabis alpina]|uniref:Uncharacterized protein n=1 Tax=Arabis alpina TaxID=50452 RepID=A0A087G9T9_ARAAL|nr:hypothetical protein AALP_AA8G274700 [Arabis alpina]
MLTLPPKYVEETAAISLLRFSSLSMSTVAPPRLHLSDLSSSLEQPQPKHLSRELLLSISDQPFSPRTSKSQWAWALTLSPTKSGPSNSNSDFLPYRVLIFLHILTWFCKNVYSLIYTSKYR